MAKGKTIGRGKFLKRSSQPIPNDFDDRTTNLLTEACSKKKTKVLKHISYGLRNV